MKDNHFIGFLLFILGIGGFFTLNATGFIIGSVLICVAMVIGNKEE